MSQFSQGLRFYLADPLARDIKILAYFFQRSFMTAIVQTKTQTNYSLLAWAQRLQHVAGDLSQVGSNHSRRRTLTGLVFDQIAQLRITVLTNRRFKRNGILHELPGFAHLLHGSVHLLGDLFSSGLTAEFAHQLTRSVLELVYHFDHMNRDTDSARLIGNRSRNCLANPPSRVG